MESVLSPRALARAIAVSESSLKRWADDGLIPVTRTAGGHRRILLSDALRFIREHKHAVVRPDALGLGAMDDFASLRDARHVDSEAALYDALAAGDAKRSRGMIIAWFLDGEALAALFDGPIRTAMSRLGELWQHGDEGIFIEHRATDLCIAALGQLRAILTPPTAGATVAVGCGPAGDPYILPTTMASIVLSDVGFEAVNLGPDTPDDVLIRAATRCQAKLVWRSFSAPLEQPELRRQVARLAEGIAALDADLLVGGRQIDEQPIRLDLPNVHVAHSMHELALFARGMRRSR